MFRRLDLWPTAAQFASGLFQFDGINQLATCVTLVASCILISTTWQGTNPFNESISQKSVTFVTVQLIHSIFDQISTFMELPKDVLSNCRLLRSGCSAEMVKTNIEPLVNLRMKFVIFVTNMRSVESM